MRLLDGSYCILTGVLLRRGDWDTQGLQRCAHTVERLCRESEKVAVCKSRREASPETTPADPLTLDFQSPEPQQN